MRLSTVADTWTSLRGTRSRNRKREVLAAILDDAENERPTIASWLAGELPQGKIGVGYSMLANILGAASPPAEAPTLQVEDVDGTFTDIKAQRGAGSKGRKEAMLTELVARATASERQLLLGLISGEIRQGALEGTLLEAIAHGTQVEPSLVRRAFLVSGSVAEVAQAAFEGGEAALRRYRITPFRPLKPMLAQTASSPTDALDVLDGQAWFDVKLDGVRLQIHRDGDVVRVYTRHLREVTRAVPEVVEAARTFPWRRFIVDAEALALDDDGRPLPFQVTMRRFGRKVDIEAMRRELPLTTVVFDALLLDQDEVLDLPAIERFPRLDALPEANRIDRVLLDEAEQANAFYASVIEQGHEGVMAKSPTGTYQAGSRGKAWLKIKPSHTVDLVVLAVERGSGRRSGWLSNLHLGAPNAQGEMVMLGKTFKGLTDELLAWQTRRFTELATHDDGYTVHVRPQVVVEIAFNDVQKSPRYPGGIALRFARVKRYRDDKDPADADRFEDILALLPDALS